MKNRMISKKAILGLAIGTGLIAGFSVLLSGTETRAFNPAETVRSVNAGMVIDESQEAGNYPASKLTTLQGLVIDESQEVGNYPASKLTTLQGLVIDESQEVGNYPVAKATLPHELNFDESQENGGNFMTTLRNAVIDESQEVGGYPASKRTPVQGMVVDESQEVGGYPAATLRLPHELNFDESQENGVSFMTTLRNAGLKARVSVPLNSTLKPVSLASPTAWKWHRPPPRRFFQSRSLRLFSQFKPRLDWPCWRCIKATVRRQRGIMNIF